MFLSPSQVQQQDKKKKKKKKKKKEKRKKEKKWKGGARRKRKLCFLICFPLFVDWINCNRCARSASANKREANLCLISYFKIIFHFFFLRLSVCGANWNVTNRFDGQRSRVKVPSPTVDWVNSDSLYERVFIKEILQQRGLTWKTEKVEK